MQRGFRSPRRLALSLLALMLACVWIGQTVASVLLRPPADPLRLRQWLTLGLLSYAGWHLLKASFRKLREPLEWTAAETELLGGSPLSSRQLIRYRLSTIGSAAVLKTACFCLVMLPDIHLLLSAAAGLLLGLLLVDLFRLVCELLAWGFNARQRRRMQVAVGAVAVAAAGNVAVAAWTAPGEFAGWLQLLSRLLSHGSPTWWGGKRTFASFDDHHHGAEHIAVWVKSTFLEQETLVEADPQVFFVPPYVGPSGWVGVRLDRGADWEMVAGVLEEGYRLVAPKRALARLDGARGE